VLALNHHVVVIIVAPSFLMLGGGDFVNQESTRGEKKDKFPSTPTWTRNKSQLRLASPRCSSPLE